MARVFYRVVVSQLCQPEPSVPRAAVSLGVAGGLVMMLALLASLGCADRGEADDAGPAPAIDGGGLPDGFAGDGPSGTDTGPDPALAAREDDCFDFRDDDFDSVTDCADPGCGAETVCCALGSEAAGCCTPGAPSALDLGPCAPGDDARSCAVGVEAFGRAALTVTEGLSACGGPARSLVPGADDLVDSGLVLPGVLDPAVSRIVIDFTLGATPRVGLARAAIALVGVERPQARVLPLLAVVTSEGQLRVVIGEAEVFRAPMPADCLSGVSLQLVIEPSGAYSLTRVGGPLLHGGTIVPPNRGRVAVYGRHDGLSPAAWLGGVSVRRDVCSRLAPERSSTPILTGVSRDVRVGRVTVARVAPATAGPSMLGRGAIEIDGRILACTEVEGGIQVDEASNPLVPAGTPSAGPDWAGGASDPQLIATDSGYQLVFTGLDDDGSTAIFARGYSRSLGSPGEALPLFTSAQAQAIDPEVRAIDNPSYFEFRTTHYLLFRATTDAGTDLRLVALNADLTDSLTEGMPPAAQARDASFAESPQPGVLRESGVSDGFDRDEIGAARPVDLHDGVLRILYAGRRGTRWAIGGLVTADLVHYDEVGAGAPLLGPSGSGFDALGVLEPEPVIVDSGATTELLLYYTGTTGTASSLGSATQAIHAGAT